MYLQFDVLNQYFNKYQNPSMQKIHQTQYQNQPFNWEQSNDQPIPVVLYKTSSEDAESYLFRSIHVPQQKNQSLEILKVKQEKGSQQQLAIETDPMKQNYPLKLKNNQKKDEQLYWPNQRHKIISKSSKRHSKKGPDYRKNICGYITKKIVKEAVSNQYADVLSQLCLKFGVEIKYFQRTFKVFQNITGPTHLYNLVNPRLKGLSCQEQIKEIQAKRVFRIFFIWFLRYRYIRYIIAQGKMQKKDVYIRYKNKELFYLITQQAQLSQDNAETHIKMLSSQTVISHGQQSRIFNNKAYLEVAKQSMMQWYQEGRSIQPQKEQIERTVLSPQSQIIDKTQLLFREQQTPDTKTLSFEQLVLDYLN